MSSRVVGAEAGQGYPHMMHEAALSMRFTCDTNIDTIKRHSVYFHLAASLRPPGDAHAR